MAEKKQEKAVSAKKGRRSQEQTEAREQVAALLLLAAAILLLCILVIKGASLWGALHRFCLGLFGPCAFLLPPLMVYIAIKLSRGKNAVSVSTTLWQGALLTVLVSSTLHIFVADTDKGYLASLGAAYESGKELRGGGFFGALLGDLFERLFTDTGAKIILILLLFVFLMLVTGTTVASLYRVMKKPVEKTKETLEGAAANIREKAQAREADKNIDVDLGEGYPDGKGGFRRSGKRVDIPLDGEEPFPAGELTVSDPVPALPPDQPKKPEPKSAAKQEEKQPAAGADDSIAKELEGAAENPPAAPAYRYPPITLLAAPKPQNVSVARQEQQQTADLLIKTLQDFGISTTLVGVTRGPSVTRYELEPSAGVKLSRITGLADDITMRLATSGVRIEAPIPNKAAVGIEVPNRTRISVCLRELIDTPEFSTAKSKLTVALGRDITGKVVLADLADMPHLLIAGTTGSGKSVCTNTMIQSILFRASPEEVRLLLIDPKQVEFGMYNGIPHLLVPVVTDARKAAGALGWAVTEMLARYKAFAENNVRNLKEFNALAKKSDTLTPKPQILIVIDELSDLMMAASNEVEDAIVRLAQMARAAGMHLVIATQRPSVDVITGLIKANIPSRLALTVASGVDSRTILDSVGAEKLLGRGDMLFMPLGMSKPMRIQGGYIDITEIEAVVSFLKGETGEQVYDDAIMQEIERQASAAGKGNSRAASEDEEDEEGSDEMLPQAVEVVIDAGMASTSLVQRKLRLGYARAGRLIDEMERRGIVGPHEGSKPRQVLITRQQWMEMNATRDFTEE